MAYQQPCDTYFVESHDPTNTYRSTNGFIKMMSRKRQEEMSDELSRQAAENYMEDIVGHMKVMEVNSRDL